MRVKLTKIRIYKYESEMKLFLFLLFFISLNKNIHLIYFTLQFCIDEVHRKTCEISSKEIFDSRYPKNYVRIHTKKKPLTFEICLNVFSREINLNMLKLPQKKNIVCEACLKAFSNNNNLKKTS